MNFLQVAARASGDIKVERQVSVEGGEPVTFVFRKLGAGEAESLFEGVKKDGRNKGLRNRVIAAIVSAKSPDGEEIPCTAEDAKQITNELANELQTIALEVNGLAGGEKKASGDDSDSSTS